MTAEVRSDRYRKVAEKELEHGNPRDPVLNESIEAAADTGADLTEEYARRRTEQMLADEQEREAMEKRRMKLQRELDDQEPKMLVRTLTLISIIGTRGSDRLLDLEALSTRSDFYTKKPESLHSPAFALLRFSVA